MQAKVNGTKYEFYLEGPISERTEIFEYQMKSPTEVLVDMDKVTFINSVGVKNWISWTLKVPSTAKFELQKCPFVIVNQINMVHGFLPAHARLLSFYAPYACECGAEQNMLFTRGKEFEYAQPGVEAKLEYPEEIPCKKCKGNLEPDFFKEKINKFLTP